MFLFPLIIGCASTETKKPIIFVDKPNSIPADIPSQFLNRYYVLIDKEDKEFKKLLTDEERQEFIDKFWLERDPDPSTSENEYKNEIDERINDIADEVFFSTHGTTGLLFRSNGGFRGDMAKVYLLHGEPDVMDTLEGNSFVPMMLWIYGNPNNGSILYAFLFYQKSFSGSYRLFSQDSYRMDSCGAINEVAVFRSFGYAGGMQAQACPDELTRVYYDIYNSSGKGGVIDGYVFAWALFNFSQGSSSLQGKALQPPKPASEIAKQSNARITGEAPKLVGTSGADYILASCGNCNSIIPAELSLGERFTISASWKNFDWMARGEQLELSIKYRIIFEGHNRSKPIVLEDVVVMDMKKRSLDEYSEMIVVVDLVKPEQVAAIPSGTYQVSVYIKNTLTSKYNAWDKEFIKQ